jgi:hypothetical protein
MSCKHSLFLFLMYLQYEVTKEDLDLLYMLLVCLINLLSLLFSKLIKKYNWYF